MPMPGYRFVTGTLLLVAPAGYAVHAQDPVDPYIRAKQLEIILPAGAPREQQNARLAAFTTATRAIRSCKQVEAVARKVRGTVKYSPKVRLASLPTEVRRLLAEAGPERATRLFGKAPVVRVLIQCGTPFTPTSRKEPLV